MLLSPFRLFEAGEGDLEFDRPEVLTIPAVLPFTFGERGARGELTRRLCRGLTDASCSFFFAAAFLKFIMKFRLDLEKRVVRYGMALSRISVDSTSNA